MDTSAKAEDEKTKTETEASPSSSNNKRPFSPSGKGREQSSNSNKKRTKKDAAKNNTRRGWNVDNRDREPHKGSFAHSALREQFGVSLDGCETFEKTVKRKVVLLLGFLGTKYGGFQVNEEQRTLQAEVELALFKAGMLSESNFGFPFKYSWSTSARTDKGVHACAQVCSLKVELPESCLEDLESVRQRLEGLLPSDVRVLDLQRVTRSFCAKTQRDRVRYQYVIPSFLIHSDYRGLLEEQGVPLEGRKEIARDSLSKEEIAKLQNALKGYRSTEEQRNLLQAALKKYEKTHSFHNFTKGIKPTEATATRYIESFHVQDPVIIDGLEWIPTQVLGQSFLLHQIRKMVSMALDVARGAVPLEFLDKALSKEVIIKINLAPPQGLFLEMSYYGGYNRRKGSQNTELPDLNWTVEGPSLDRWEAFRSTIRRHIVEEEEQEGNFVKYIYIQECIFGVRECYGLDGSIPPGDNAESEIFQEVVDDKKKEI